MPAISDWPAWQHDCNRYRRQTLRSVTPPAIWLMVDGDREEIGQSGQLASVAAGVAVCPSMLADGSQRGGLCIAGA